jgi:hypothetical protein
MPNRFETPPVYLASGNPERESNATLHAPGQLGMRFTVIQPTREPPGTEEGRSKRYQIVRTDSTMAATPAEGDVMWWSDRPNYVVTNSPTGRQGQVAGVFQNNHLSYPVPPGYYTCIQIGGPGKVRFVVPPTSAPDATGKFVVPSSTAGRADILAAGTAATYPQIGRTAGGSINGQSLCVVDIDVDETT